MRKHVFKIFMRPLTASLALTAVVFVVVYTLLFVAPQPQRALYALWADPGQILFFSAALFVVYGIPTWLLIFVVLKCVAALRAQRKAAGSIAHPRDSEHAELSESAHDR
jgi:hypothetical protein